MADSKQETHRPGALKQQNKSHKHGRHSSKGAIDVKNKGNPLFVVKSRLIIMISGRVELKALAGKKRGVMKKVDRRNQVYLLWAWL